MNKVVFPLAFLHLPGVADLAPEFKLVLVFAANHVNAAGVTRFDDYTCQLLPAIPPSTIRGICVDLARRGIAAYDSATNEFFIRNSFSWHRAPSEIEHTSWSVQVLARLRDVVSHEVRQVVRADIEAAPAARLDTVVLPGNALALPPRRRGNEEGWSASETLVAAALQLDPGQTASGVYLPSFSALGALCSLPAATVKECVISLSAGARRVVQWDGRTGEVFTPGRLRAAHKRQRKEVDIAGKLIVSTPIFNSYCREFTNSFGKSPEISTVSRLADFSLYKKIGRKKAASPPVDSATASENASNLLNTLNSRKAA